MTNPDATPSRDAMIRSFETQIRWCDSLGSPFTARLLDLTHQDLQRGGVLAALLDHWPGDPVADAVPLRVAGALHALVLSGAESELAACYPPHPAAEDADRLDSTLRDVLARRRSFIERFIASPPQTNEVGRSAVLLGGFLEIACATRLPLTLLEIGASAGLNLFWDRFAYRLGTVSWGDPASPVSLAPEWTGPPPPIDARVEVAGRAACDLAPVDLEDPDQRLRLKAFIWPDQAARLARLDGAIGLARAAGVRVEQSDAASWLRRRLAMPVEGGTTVLYHSIMWHYMPAGTRAEITATVEAAAARATAAAPLAWLRYEPVAAGKPTELNLTLWPGEHRTRLATAHAHGSAVEWSGNSG
ncbi:MAG TPA: DUF2332 domain-containing protein [Stellaceae bacterium]|nr:DUF2332 domain-containing protein [Stellaceae bacterium]